MKAPQKMLDKKLVLLLTAVGLAGMFVIIGISYCSWQAGTDPNELLRKTINEAIEDNRSRLSCANLVWNSEYKGYGLWSNKPEITGNHQLYWNNKKIAISSKTSTTVRDPNGQVSTNQEMTALTYDGKTYRVAEMPPGLAGKVQMLISKKPTYHFRTNNYLLTVGWQGRGGRNHVPKATEPGVEQWITEESKTIARTFRNTRTGYVGIRTYDIEKAYGLVTYLNYHKQDVLQSQTTFEYMQLSDGSWFPVSVITEGYNNKNGELLYRDKIKLDSSKSVFNDPSAIPEGAFELEVGPNTEVTDLTSLKTRLKRFLNNF